MRDWYTQAQDMIAANMMTQGGWVVLITVSAVHGSAPREAGTKMLVGPDSIRGTIGGGTLEYKAIQQARIVGTANTAPVREFDFPLGPKTQQCCGGRVELLVERFDARHLDMLQHIEQAGPEGQLVSNLDGDSPVKEIIPGSVDGVTKTQSQLIEPLTDSRTRLYLFGAGHVGKAIVARIDGLPFRVTWIDSRADQFPTVIPNNVTVAVTPSSADRVTQAAPNSVFLVMTHSHRIDFAVTAAILARGDARYCGLIGSKTKRATFLKRFITEQGLSDDQCQGLTCPIGLKSITGKAPEIVAISVIAQLLEIAA